MQKWWSEIDKVYFRKDEIDEHQLLFKNFIYINNNKE